MDKEGCFIIEKACEDGRGSRFLRGLKEGGGSRTGKQIRMVGAIHLSPECSEGDELPLPPG